MRGISWKFSVGGGLGICHSSVMPPQGFASAFLPLKRATTKFPRKMKIPVARRKPPIEAIT